MIQAEAAGYEVKQQHQAAQEEQWTEIITPRKSLFDIKLREVWHYRDLIFLFVKRDLAAQFRQTILGPLWHVVQPVLTTILFMFVFNRIAKISTDALPPVLFYMASLTIWNYFAACLSATSSTFVANAGIFGKVYFPRLVTPLAVVVSNMSKFAIQFCLLVVVTGWQIITGKYIFIPGWHLFLMPVIIIVMAMLGLGVGIIISSLTTKYRDLTVLITFGVQLLMYATPVAYPMSFLEQTKYKTYIQLNPLSSLVEGFRYSLFGQGTFSATQFIYSVVFAIISLVIGVIIFSRVERTFMDTV